MLAAIAVEQAGADPLIPETLAKARCLYIMELEDGVLSAVLPLAHEQDAVRIIGEQGCRALICGQIGADAREALRCLGVHCFDGYLYRVQQVRRLLYTGVLPVI